MARRSAVLTARRVQTEKQPGLYADGGGLYLQVAPTGAKTWIYRFQLAGRRRDMGLGSAYVFSLAEAREKATAARRLVAERLDPIEDRARRLSAAKLVDAKAMIFKACAEGYLESHRAAWRNAKHRAQWEATLEAYVYPVFGGLAVQDIDVGLVMRAVEPLWSTKPE